MLGIYFNLNNVLLFSSSTVHRGEEGNLEFDVQLFSIVQYMLLRVFDFNLKRNQENEVLFLKN